MGRKKSKIPLEVHLNGRRVGNLLRSVTGAMEFSYCEEWLDSDQAMPISCSIPLREGAFRGPEIHAYFDNLLPDNEEIRRRIAEKFSAGGKSAFDLLAAIGRDCVGALQFIPEGTGTTQAPVDGKPLKDQEIGEILRNLRAAPLGLYRDREFRISLAGAQEKTALLYWKKKWRLPIGATPTTHILKTQMGSLPNGIDLSKSVENEWMCLKIAEHFGLPVAKAEIHDFDGIRCLVVERFDRRWLEDGKHCERVPQEDLCQALGVPGNLKYESDGGPGIKAIMDLLNSSDHRDEDRARFMRAQVVFFLLAAIDGHAKNFSLRLGTSGFRMTPLYDIMTAHPAIHARKLEPKEAKLAMCVGSNRHYRIREILRRHWEQTADRCAFPRGELDALLGDLGQRGRSMDDLAKSLEKSAPPKLIDVTLAGIQIGLKRLI